MGIWTYLKKKTILSAISNWAEIIQPVSGYLPGIIGVVSSDQANAFGASPEGRLLNILQGRSTEQSNLDAFLAIGALDFTSLDYQPAPLPPSSKWDLYATVFHEAGHALGFTSLNEVDEKGYPKSFDKELSIWDTHLHDENGQAAQAGQKIIYQPDDNDSDAFDIRQSMVYFNERSAAKSKIYFLGMHVNDVLQRVWPGVPISADDLSHTDLKNSLMSHQNYRNYTTFMEVELAMLQDMGYKIDRRNFYGYSVYGDKQTVVNSNGYFARNAEGTAYLPGQHNMTTLGIGLHIYGSDNTITQAADLLTKGAGGVGVRIDGIGNTLIVPSSTRIYADGINGHGVMISYGKEHQIIHQGDIQALGVNGVAARFDFGNNAISNAAEYRGSYIFSGSGLSLNDLFYGEEWAEVRERRSLSDHDAMLVNRFDITGKLAGARAAIYISNNALVGNVNIMRGAELQGDIVSEYNQRDEYGQQRLTYLSFGQLPDSQGNVTEQHDPDFKHKYAGNIRGLANLALRIQGGVISLNGQHELYNAVIAAGATLAGNSHYALHPKEDFINQGILSPGNSLGYVHINSDYQQRASGTLLLEFNATEQDRFVVDGIADLDGQLHFSAQVDWYANNWLTNIDAVQAQTIQGGFAHLSIQNNSPILRFSAIPTQEQKYQLSVIRPSNAYSQYATDKNKQQLGRALDNIAVQARSDIQPLYRALDFSNTDGSDISNALSQLTPVAYSALISSTLQREYQLSDLISAYMLAKFDPSQLNNDTQGNVRGFAMSLGGRSRNDTQDSLIGYRASYYGVIFGTETSVGLHQRLGLYGIASQQSVTPNTMNASSGTGTVFHLGMHTHYAVDPDAGLYLYGHGRLGIERNHFERSLSIQGIHNRIQSDWTSWTGTLRLGAGYHWVLSDKVRTGPLVSLDYIFLSHPNIIESSLARNDIVRLTLAEKRLHTLRSTLGIHASTNLNETWQADAQVGWDSALWRNRVTQDAAFVNYANVPFSTDNQITQRNALTLQAGFVYQPKKYLNIKGSVATQWSKSGSHAQSANLVVLWKF